MKKIIILLTIILGSLASLSAQPFQVKGTVVDEDGAPIAGATVVEKGTVNGTVSMAGGSFTITVSNPSAVLMVTFVGFDPVEQTVTGARMQILMYASATEIENVVIVGFGVQRKESVVGAISTVSPEDLQKMGSTNLSTALAGKVSGITFTIPSGRPGGDQANLYIRGQATTADATPLVLVDGVERDYNQVDPEDIEHLSVLKDASATAVYGVRGANGVILITTKRGQEGKPVINMSYKLSMQQPTKMPTFLGSYDHAILRNESLANDVAPLSFSDEDIEHYRLKDAPYTHPDNDYIKDFVRKTTPMHTLNFSVRGGTPKVKYFVSLNGFMQDGMFKQFDGKYPSNSNFKKLNLRSNLDFTLTKTTDLSLDLNGRLQQRQNNTQGINDNSLFSLMYETPPMAYPYRNPDGSYGANTAMGVENILAVLSDWGYTRRADNILESTVRLNQKLDFITKGLSVMGMVSFNSYYESGTKVYYNPPTFVYKADGSYAAGVEEAVPSISNQAGAGHRWRTNIEVGANYNRKFGKHAVTGMMIYTQTQEFANVDDPVAFLGYSGRATYAFRDTYLAEVNVAYNGSDQFDKDHRYAWFPSFSLGYILSNEQFFDPAKSVISFLKIRGSYGQVGNYKIGASRFLYLQMYEKDGNYFFGKDASFGGITALKEGNLGNENVTWEVGYKSNVGLDMELFNDLSVTLDLFYERRENIFYERQTTPATLGVGTSPENIGIANNKGFEIELSYNKAFSRSLSVFASGMFSYSRNKLVYRDEVNRKYEYLRQSGKQIGQFFGHTVLGYYIPDDFIMVEGVRTLSPELPQPQYPVQPGDFKYWDRNSDGAIDDFDKGDIMERRLPRFVYNLSYGMRWKGLDFSMMWQGAGGHSVHLTKALYEPVREKNRFQEIHLYRWTEERWANGEEIRYPRLSSNTNQHNQTANTFFMKKGDYLRLKNFEIGYTFNKEHLKFVGMQSLRIYVGGTNSLTFSHIDNFDPEMGNSDGFFYPIMKTWNLGVNIKF